MNKIYITIVARKEQRVLYACVFSNRYGCTVADTLNDVCSATRGCHNKYFKLNNYTVTFQNKQESAFTHLVLTQGTINGPRLSKQQPITCHSNNPGIASAGNFSLFFQSPPTYTYVLNTLHETFLCNSSYRSIALRPFHIHWYNTAPFLMLALNTTLS